MEDYIVRPADFFEKEVIEYFYPSSEIQTGYPIMWPSMSHVRIRPQELSVWAGINGHGKSMIVSQVALMAAYHKEKTVIASFEMPAKKTLGRMVLQAIGKTSPTHSEVRDCLNWMRDYISVYNFVGRGDVNSMRHNFRVACETEGATQFVIDSLMKCGLAEDDYSKQKFLVEDFHNDAMSLYAHVHLVAHARKSKDEGDKPGKMDVSGSAGITNIADNVYTVWRNKPKEAKRHDCFRKKIPLPPDFDDSPDCIVECVKSREQGGDAEKPYWLWYNHKTHQYLDRDMTAIDYTDSCEEPF